MAFRLPSAGMDSNELEALTLQTRALTYDTSYHCEPIKVRQPLHSSAALTETKTSQMFRHRTQSAQVAPSDHQLTRQPQAALTFVSHGLIPPLDPVAEAASILVEASSDPPGRIIAASVPPQEAQNTASHRWPSAKRINALASATLSESKADPDISPGSLLANLDAATTEAIRRAAATVRSQMPVADTGASVMLGANDSRGGRETAQTASLGSHSGIMGNCGSGYFGDAIRGKVSS